MSDESALPQVDKELACRVEDYSDDFWASTDRDPREDVHAYFQYPAMMVPKLQRELIKLVLSLQPMIRDVLDPFVGAGTTMTACMPLGLNFTGQDINPLAALVSRAKMGPFFHKALPIKTERVLERINADKGDQIEADFTNLDKWFQPEIQLELSKICRAIRLETSLWARRFLWVTLAETVRLTSNSRTSTYKLHIRPSAEIESREITAVETFTSTLDQNLDDFLEFRNSLDKAGCLRRGRYIGKLHVHLQDSAVKILLPPDDAEQYDLLITSPPYGDNTSTVPYGQHSYLPLQWIDFKDIDANAVDKDWLRSTYEIDRRSLGGQKPRGLEKHIDYMEQRSQSYSGTIKLLRERPRDRRSRVTAFLYDLDRAIDPIVQSLGKNAYLIWIVGNRHVGGIEIPTDSILVELLERREVKLVTRVTRRIVFRRMAARNRIASMMRQEHILVFRKVGE